MTFVKTVSGTAVRVEDVRLVRREPNSDEVTLCLDGGDEHKAAGDTWLIATRSSSVQILPAHRGTFVLHACVENGKVSVGRETVIAWAVYEVGGVDPVTFTGVNQALDFCPTVLHPDGSVHDISGFFESYDQWLEEVRRENAKPIAGKASGSTSVH